MVAVSLLGGSLWLFDCGWGLGCCYVVSCMLLCHGCCTVSLSLFAGPERILRRFSVFSEEPCKSTITTTEPCSPVFKEAQPRSSSIKTSVSQAFSLVHSHIIVSMFCNCSLFCNKVSSRIVLTSKGFSVFFWITLSHEVSRHFPHTCTSTYANFKNLLYICCTLADIPLHWWRI